MSIRPYTTADLRAEAARQHAAAAEDPDFMGIGEQMDSTAIGSTVDDEQPKTWDLLSRDDFEAAQRAVDDLLHGAAGTSRWAVDLGADGLVPGHQHIDVAGGVARLHIAFQPDLSEEQRAQVARNVATILGEKVVEA